MRHSFKASIEFCITNEGPDPFTKASDKALIYLMENIRGNGIMDVAVGQPNPESIGNEL
jgi:hypothetical protein